MYSSVPRRRKSNKPRKFTEATATDWLQKRIFFGVGPRHLGWQFPEYEILEDDTEVQVTSCGPRFWRTPMLEDWYKWSPLRDHLKGAFRGLVRTDATHVPFIGVDEDRHTGEVKTEVHIREVIRTGRLLKERFSFALGHRLNWCVEVNPNNGSVKFFGWSNRPIRIDVAKIIGELIHEAMGRNGLLGTKSCREVFPFNHPQVLLPMRIDKTTIIETGVLPMCVRKKRNPFIGGMDDYEAYSVLDFCQWLQRGGHFCERTLLETLEQSCANLPDEVHVPKVEVDQSDSLQDSANMATESGKRSWRYSGQGADNPNSFERQHEALLEFCRRAKRVVTMEEALAYIKANDLFTGSWEHNCGRRRGRVKWILKRIAKTFDSAKCRGVRHEIKVGQYNNWARSHVGSTGIKGRDRRSIDEYGNEVVTRSRYRVDWQFVSMVCSIVEFCLVDSPNEDGSLPQARAEELWSRCFEGGQVQVRFCEKKWAICRDWLERLGVVKIVDRNWRRGQAMRWKVGDGFDRLPQWWKRERRPSLLEAVALEAFLEDGKQTTTLLNSYPTQGGSDLVDCVPGVSGFTRPPP